MQIVTWNINSVRTRLDNLLRYLREVAPDVLCLQEIKCTDEQFPRLEIEAEGYNVAVHGQKSWNGVAILSKRPMETQAGLAGDDADTQSRWLEAVVTTDTVPVRVCCLYLPNGNPPDTEKYTYKLAWMDRLHARAKALLALRGAARRRRRLQRHSGAARRVGRAGLGRRRALPAADARPLPRPAQTSGSPTRCVRRRTRPASTRSGTTRPAPGSETRASASTTSCSRPKPPTGSPR